MVAVARFNLILLISGLLNLQNDAQPTCYKRVPLFFLIDRQRTVFGGTIHPPQHPARFQTHGSSLQVFLELIKTVNLHEVLLHLQPLMCRAMPLAEVTTLGVAGAIAGAFLGPAVAVVACPILAAAGGMLGDAIVRGKGWAYAIAAWRQRRMVGCITNCCSDTIQYLFVQDLLL